MLTLPEDKAAIFAQLEAVLNPHSSKDTVYIERGGAVPKGLPSNLLVLDTPNGTYITTNKKKASAIKSAKTAEQLESMNGELLYNKKSGGKGTGLMAVAMNAKGLPVAEIGTDPDHLEQDLMEAQAQAPRDGTVGVLPVQQILQARVGRLAMEQQRG